MQERFKHIKVPIMMTVGRLMDRGRMNESYDQQVDRQMRTAYMSARLGGNPDFDPAKPYWDNPNLWYYTRNVRTNQ